MPMAQLEQANLQDFRPDPLEPRAEQVERYVSQLRGICAEQPELARREAWEQIRLAGARAGAKRREAHDSLNRIFRLGNPPSRPLNGPQRGILVTPTTFATLDPLFRGIARAWMPWVGKRFDSANETGDNLLLASARVPVKLMWPSYELESAGEERYAAFRFRTHTDPGTIDSDRDTLKIDYDSDDNPAFLIRNILDELVEVVPGAYLGKVLLRRGTPKAQRWNLVGYFALEPPALERELEFDQAVTIAAPAPAAI
jgi:hypothetical protein